MPEASEVVEQPHQPVADAAPTSVDKPEADVAIQYDEKSQKWIAPPRDDKGRFARVRESLAKSQAKMSYLTAMQQGAVDPTEEMSPEQWALAREMQIRNKTQNVNPPEVPEEKAPAVGAKHEGNEQELSPEEVQRFERHHDFMTTLAAKRAIDPATKEALLGIGKAVAAGATPSAVAYLGTVISECEHPHEVLHALGADPETIFLFTRMPPQAMAQSVQSLSKQIAMQKAASVKPPKPAPPAPVGARASSGAFDVNDENTDIEEWARQRNKQLAERRSRQ